MKTLNTYFYNKEHLEDFIAAPQFQEHLNSSISVFVKVYAGVADFLQLEYMLGELTRLLPNAYIVGASTTGEIMDAEMSSNKVILSFNFFKETQFKIGIFNYKAIRSEADLISRIENDYVGSNTKGLLVFSTISGYSIDVILDKLSRSFPQIPVFGGIAGMNENSGFDFVICNGQISTRAVVFATFDSDSLFITTNYHLNWRAIGKELTITESNGYVIDKIDDLPAANVYAHYLGDSVIKGLPYSGSAFPLIFKKASINVARVVNRVNENGGIEMSADVEVGDRFRFSFGHVGSILSKGKEMVDNFREIPVESVWVFSCASRLNFLQKAAQLELNPLKEIAPAVGFFTSGEFFYRNGYNYLLNDTMTLVALSEEDNRLSQEQISKATKLVVTDVSDKQTQILQAMNTLITSVTQELNQANEELYSTNEELNAVLNQLQSRAEIIEKLHKNVTSSIQYASRIQNAMLPSVECLQEIFPESFVMYKPRDVVSGDFYWYKEIDDSVYVAAVDCTGHGVPGAFMSMLGISFLDEIVTERSCSTSGQILEQLREKIKHA